MNCYTVLDKEGDDFLWRKPLDGVVNMVPCLDSSVGFSSV